MLELQHVHKHYESPGRAEAAPVLRDISLRVAAGQALAIVGPSGCGKSTLLNIMGALDAPTRGRVLLDGRDLAGLTDKALAEVRNRDIGFIFQLHHLLGQLTVLENVLVPTLAGGRNARRQTRQRAESLLERVGLRDFMAYRPAQLSGGQRQRVAVARALINRPRILLADEPTGSLDQATAAQIGELLLQVHAAEGAALVVVTHALSLAGLLPRTLTLQGGALQ